MSFLTDNPRLSAALEKLNAVGQQLLARIKRIDWSEVADQAPLALNRFAWFFAVLLLGYTIHAKQVWPYPIFKNGLEAITDIALHAKSYLGLFPTRSAVHKPGTDSGVVIHKPEKVEPGNIFLAGIFGERNLMKLMSPEGKELHRWTVPFYKAIPNLDHILPVELRPRNETMTHIHGAHVFRDGSVVFNFDYHGLVSVDACSNIQWVKPQMTHHAVTGAEDGTLWVLSRNHYDKPVAHLPLLKPPFFEDTVLHISRDGKILKEISLPKLFDKNDLHALVSATGTLEPENKYDDFLHANDIEILTAEKAAAFPQFEAGDIAISMRNVNLLIVFDPQTEKVKWTHTGPWLRQHDPDFLSDGTISVYDNRWAGIENVRRLGGSRILTIDPRTNAVKTTYQSKKNEPLFFTHIMGVHQTFESGNILIAEPTRGRVFEVTRDGEIVWQFINRLNADYLGHVTIAEKFPVDYFNFRTGQCQPKGDAS